MLFMVDPSHPQDPKDPFSKAVVPTFALNRSAAENLERMTQ